MWNWRGLSPSERIPVQLFNIRLSLVENCLSCIVNNIRRQGGKCPVKNVDHHVVNVMIFICVELVRNNENVKPFFDEPFERMEITMEVVQHEFFQFIWIRKK